MTETLFDIVIVGYGSIGQMLAILLGKMGYRVAMLLLSLLLFASACGGASSASASNDPNEILIGASIPKSGSLAAFGRGCQVDL
jgi:glycine/D-amino acid oxidase-like deaminating enzyme